MPSKFLLLSVCFVGVLLALVPAVGAQTANFQGNCSWDAGHTNFSCVFDSRRPSANPSACPGSFMWKIRWDFHDGTSTGLVSPTLYWISRSYSSGVVNPSITLTVFCWSGASPTMKRYVNHPFGIPGGININGAWN